MPEPTDVDRFNRQQPRYRLGRRVGAGGAAEVFVARDLLLERDVAVKVFAARGDDPEQLQAQQREARLLASLRHHSLVTLFDAGVDFAPDGAPQVFLVMELVQGSDLRTRLRRGPLPVLHAAHLGFDLADALAYLHLRGITHRDVKPANALLADWSESRRPRVKLADVGIALLAGEREEPDGETAGTAAYLSPEQAAGEPIGPPTDVYALGLVVLEAVTGRLSFPGGVLESALARLERSPVVPPELPPAWRDLLGAMTARRAADRPSAAQVAVAFRQILVDEVAAASGVEAVAVVDRLAAVRRYDLLAGGSDPALDRIAGLAVRLLPVQAAVIAVHDDDRLLVKARAGAIAVGGRDYLPGTLEAAPIAVPDLALADPPPAAAVAPGARGYASAPVTTHDGLAIGVVAALAASPWSPSAADLDTLADLADAVMHEVEMRRAVRRLLRPLRLAGA